MHGGLSGRADGGVGESTRQKPSRALLDHE